MRLVEPSVASQDTITLMQKAPDYMQPTWWERLKGAKIKYIPINLPGRTTIGNCKIDFEDRAHEAYAFMDAYMNYKVGDPRPQKFTEVFVLPDGRAVRYVGISPCAYEESQHDRQTVFECYLDYFDFNVTGEGPPE